MKAKFTLDDLKVGYVVKLRNDELRMVCQIGAQDTLILVNQLGQWNYKSSWNYDLTAKALSFNPGYGRYTHKYTEYDIVEVYGFVNKSDFYGEARGMNVSHRPVLYSRAKTKKMTVSEIEEKLGYKIEIVAEE